MTILEGLIQGSQQWLAVRAQHFTASEAPAMMGVSKYTSRSELIKQKATGITPDVSPETQRLFDRGHATEAAARGMAEAIVGAELYPVTCVDVVDGLPLLASMDGLTMDERIGFEHKLWSEGLAEQVRAGSLEPHYTVQMDQQLAVSGAEKILFMCSDGAPERMVWCWYAGIPDARTTLIAGWRQFAADVAAYKPAEVVPVVVAEPVEALPAVLVKVSGEISITANFAAFEAKLREFLEHRLIREPKSDQDFADLDVQIKAMKGAEAALDSAEGQMLAQIQSVDSAKKTKDMLHKLVRDNRLMAEKLLAGEKERRKGEIVAGGVSALREHYAGLLKRVGVPFTVEADFAGVIKGKKSLSSMEDAIATELARAKIEANRIADLIDANRKAMDEADSAGLFPDFAQVCTKPADDFANLIANRRAQAQARLDAERERIRAEEAARLEREAAAKRAEEERLQREADARAERERLAALNTPEQGTQQVLKAEASTPDATDRDAPAHASPVGGPMGAGQPAAAGPTGGHAPAPQVRAFVAAPAANETPTMTLGALNARLGFTCSADFLESLGFVAHRDRAASLYRHSQFPDICAAIAQHVKQVAQSPVKAAA